MSGVRAQQDEPRTLSFAEIVRGRDASVPATDDGYLYAVKLAMVVTGVDNNYANQILRRLGDDVFPSSKIVERNTGGSGNSKTKLVSLKDAIQLVMVLPGKVAKETRAQFAGVIERYIAGDRSLHAEIEANAGSGSGLARLARESLGIQEEEDAVVSIGLKRRREELELLKLEHEINSMIVDNRIKQHNHLVAIKTELEDLTDPAKRNLDDRTRLMLQDALQNSIFHALEPAAAGARTAITNGPSPNEPISISSVAAELGYKPTTEDSKRIGADLKKRYVKLHNNPPSKHKQLLGGLVMNVNSYTEQDRALVVEALHAYFNPCDPDVGE